MTSDHKRSVLLIEPPHYRLFKDSYSLQRYPLSLAYLAAVISRATAWKVAVYNADFAPQCEPMKASCLSGGGFSNYLENLRCRSAPIWGEIASVILATKPDVIGISCKSPTFASACRVANLAKGINAETIVIVGGPHPSMVGPQVFNCRDIDVAVRGEGERTIVDLLAAIGSRRSLETVNGVAFRSDGRVIENPPRDLMDDLDLLPFPHADAAELLHDYPRYPTTAFRYVFATRGCPYNCFFCGSRNVWGRKVRFRSAEHVAGEIKALQEMGVRSVHFDDDTFGINDQYIAELCRALVRHCPGLKWSCELHVKLVNDQNLACMKAAGCFSIQLGIESGNNEILRMMRKGFTIEQALAACERIRRHDMAVEAFFIVGFPLETEATLADTVAAMKRIRGRLNFSIFTPYPGTEAFEFCKAHRLIHDDYDVALYNHQSPENSFSMHIPRTRFRTLVAAIERMVDQNNYPTPLKKILSRRTLQEVRRLGPVASLKKGMAILRNR